MNNTKSFRRVSVLVLALALITMSILGSTMAKYTSQITATYTNTAKSWSITANDNKTDFNLTASGEAYPGMTNEVKTITVKNEGEVNAVYTATLNVTDKPTNMSINMTGDITSVAIAPGESKTITVTISWPFGEDADDTTDAGSNIDFTVTIKADQSNS